MRQVTIYIFLLIAAFPIQAALLQSKLNENFNLVSFQSDDQGMSLSSGVYSFDVKRRSSGIGLTSDIMTASSWKGSVGLLLADETIKIESEPSTLNLSGRSIDMNRWLSMKAKLHFAELVPYISLAYEYNNESDSLAFNFSTGLKLLKVSDTDIQFENLLGDAIESNVELASALKTSVREGLASYYVEPVIDLRFQYRFY